MENAKLESGQEQNKKVENEAFQKYYDLLTKIM